MWLLNRTVPTPKRNLKPIPPSALSAQPPLATAFPPIQMMNQPSGATGALNSAPGSRKRRLSEQQQIAPSPIAPAPAPTAGSTAFSLVPDPLGPTTESAVTAPPPKKGRTNTPWTPAEELRLKKFRDEGKSWSEIAKVRNLVHHQEFALT